MWVNQELNNSDAFVALWLPGSEGSAVADVLFTDADGKRQYDFTGRLSFSWPNSPYDAVLNKGDEDYSPLFAYGYGLSYDSQDTLGNDLSETYEELAAFSSGKKIFTGTMQKPWVLLLSEGDTDEFVVASTASLGALSYRTIDKEVQEDAMKMTLKDAKMPSGIKIASKSFFREDVSNELLNKSSLSFMVKPDSAISQAVMLNMSCESEGDAPGSCRGSVDITEQLKGMEQGKWHEISVDLQCFSQQGVDFSGLVVPFQLLSTGNLELSISDIEFAFDTADSASIKCK
jgi:beta-glucosidase